MNALENRIWQLVAVGICVLLLAGCATAPGEPDAAETLRSQLAQLRADPDLGARAPAAMQEAEAAVRAAEEPQRDPEEARHLVYIADQKIEIARARAQVELLEEQREALREEREEVVRDARDREVQILRHRERGAG